MCRAASTASSAAPMANGKIQADQFKTKMCANFERTGACPYEAKCMFAHGDADLRTREMNIADGLTTEETIKAYQRGKKNAARRAERRRQRRAQAALEHEDETATWSEGDCAQSPVVPDTPSTVPCAKTPKDDTSSSNGSAVAEKVTLPPLAPIKMPAAMPPSAVPIAALNPLSLAMRRHSPFALAPLTESAFEPESPAVLSATILSATARSPAPYTTLATPTVCISPLVKAMSKRYRESPASFEALAS